MDYRVEEPKMQQRFGSRKKRAAHRHQAMNRHRVDKAKASQVSITSYSTIAQSILKMDGALKAKMCVMCVIVCYYDHYYYSL